MAKKEHIEKEIYRMKVRKRTTYVYVHLCTHKNRRYHFGLLAATFNVVTLFYLRLLHRHQHDDEVVHIFI